MTIKKYSRNQRFDDYEDRPSKPKQKDRSEKHFRNALRTQDLNTLSRLNNDDLDFMDEEFIDDFDYRR